MEKNRSYLVIGAGIMLLGLFILAELLGIVRDNTVYELLWPLMIFATGLGLVSSNSGRVYGYLILWVGFLLFLRQLNVFDSDAGKTILVLILCLTGLGAVMKLGDTGIKKE